MENSPITATRNFAQPAYGTMAGITSSCLEAFLTAFKSTMRDVGDSVSPETLVRFLTQADQFSNDCCQRFAVMLRETSSKLDVRDTTEAVLTRLLRNRCFETLDTILEAYIAFLAQLHFDLKQPLSTLADSRLRDLAVQHGGAGWEVQKRFKLPTAARAAALLKILEYLQALEQLPTDLLDYGASKIFSESDFELQRSYLASIRASIEESLSGAIGLIESLEIVRQRKWEQQRVAEDAAINAIASIATFQSQKAKGGTGALLLGLLCAVPIWWVSTLKDQNIYTGLFAGISAIGAIFCFCRSIIIFTKRLG